ncbi:MAG: hypothetical protein L6R37_000774 [Teloschistes peruensis]|nr:MAG: hypothetical protein L6R37_000774 [Teloschistes peruensis]
MESAQVPPTAIDASTRTELGMKGPMAEGRELENPMNPRDRNVEAPNTKKRESRATQESVKKNRDENIMGTNNSSILSKRSVERYFHPSPHFFRYFVNKPQRRSPLIHRGYWLRMYLIEQAVLKFLREPSEKRKIILNLGCATFVDIDYPELMSKKKDIIQKTAELRNLVWPVEDADGMDRNDRYVGVGCDLYDIADLSRILEREVGTRCDSCLVLCVAEVSVTYMTVHAADALIKWTTQYEDVRFCLLEQFLPDGEEHPFARKMLQHFQKLNTPLNSVCAYPLLKDQENRFLRAGYHRAVARSLWDLWQDPLTVAIDARLGLSSVEPFDEWEELVLFCSHYFLLDAVKSSGNAVLLSMNDSSPNHELTTALSNIDISGSTAYPRGMLQLSADDGWCRRFGALIPSSENTVSLHGGVSNHSRSTNCDSYWLGGHEVEGQKIPDPPTSIPARLCHTITGLAKGRYLLVGGRASPDRALSGCWLRSSVNWRAVDDLPIPLYRHCATAVAFGQSDAGVLIFGGRTTAGVAVNRWFLWQEATGWVEIRSLSQNLKPRFGAAIATTGPYSGVLLGGMTDEGSFCNETWKWSITYGSGKSPHLDFILQQNPTIAPRMGACLVWAPVGLLLIGGVSEYLIPWEEEVLCVLEGEYSAEQSLNALEASPVPDRRPEPGSRPLLVGHAAHVLDDLLLIAGGGANCFSFDASHSQAVPRVIVETADEFDRLMNKGRPFVIEGLDLGRCREEWTSSGLAKKINPGTTVTVHQAQEGNMNFQRKNFHYVKKAFGDFMREICSDGSRQYLRSLAADKPADRPAHFKEDFSSLSDDFQIPPQLGTVVRNEHSSPLRISGPVNMWLHYDVMANILCQISGKKIVALYPPRDAIHFQIPPGSSSSPIDVFSDDPSRRGHVEHARPHFRAALNEGDVLYIPPLWLHSASPLENLSVSVNVFFRNLQTGYAAGRDVYGNRDLQAYENGRKSLDRIVHSFDNLPKQIRKIYLARLAHEFMDKITARRE